MARGFVYPAAVLDWYSRRVLAWRVSILMDTAFCTEAVEEAITRYGTPEIFNTDQGSQFTNTSFTGLHVHGIRISMDGKGCWRDNVFIERLWHSVKYEEILRRDARNRPQRVIGRHKVLQPHRAEQRLVVRVGSAQTVARIWFKHNIKPHRLEGYLSSNDLAFESKAADVIGLYLNPPQHAAVFSVDEKTAIQALDRKDPVLPLSPERAERHDLDVANQPKGKEIHVVADNLSAQDQAGRAVPWRASRGAYARHSDLLVLTQLGRVVVRQDRARRDRPRGLHLRAYICSERNAILPYTVVGAVATAAHYSVLAVLSEVAAIPPGSATGVGGLCGALVAYRLNRNVTFQSAAPHRRAAPRFFLIAAFGIALSVAIVGAGTTYTQWHYLNWQLVATLTALFLTYALNRRWTFS